MASSRVAVQRHWTRIIQRWPVDHVRPENTSFQKLMQSRLDNLAGSPSANTKAQSVKSNEALVTATKFRRFDEAQELKQAEALYNLLENKYARKYPFPETLRYPDFNPTYYDDLIEELNAAPNRTPLQRWWLRFKGRFRFA